MSETIRDYLEAGTVVLKELEKAGIYEPKKPTTELLTDILTFVTAEAKLNDTKLDFYLKKIRQTLAKFKEIEDDQVFLTLTRQLIKGTLALATIIEDY